MFRILRQNLENHQNLCIPYKNHENHEIYRIPLQNYENHKQTKKSMPESRKS